MKRGFGRGPVGLLIGALVALTVITAAVSAHGPARAPEPDDSGKTFRYVFPVETGRDGEIPLSPRSAVRPWWDISLVFSVKGDYTVRAQGTPVEGTYAYRARWKGRLELDSDEDLLLVHIGTEILEWSLRETCGSDGIEIAFEPAAGPVPTLRVDYLIRDGSEIEFVFRLAGISVPLHASELAVPLDLPRSSSRQAGPPGHGYGDYVQSGSCRVAIPQDDLTVQAPERRFAWEWSRERVAGPAGRPVRIGHRHSAEAIVSVIIHGTYFWP